MTASKIIFGIDEAGRGPLVGPVVAACVYIPDEVSAHSFWAEVTDSKKLSAKKRETLFTLITENCTYGIAEASATEIDTLNIHHATLLAMKRAYNIFCHPEQSEGSEVSERDPSVTMLPQDDRLVLVDGKFCPKLPCPTQAVVKGDSKHMQIAAASILAKVTRDRMLARLHEEYPFYNWIKNAGYGTAEHMAGLEAHGVTPYHRLSFAPCKKYAA